MRLLSSICLLAYCLLVKNVCCLELNQDALHIWFVLLCSVFKGLLHRECFPIRFWLPLQLLYHIRETSDCQLFFKSFFRFRFSKSFGNSFIITYRLLFVKNFFEVFFDRIKLRKWFFFNDSVILSCHFQHVNNLFFII